MRFTVNAETDRELRRLADQFDVFGRPRSALAGYAFYAGLKRMRVKGAAVVINEILSENIRRGNEE